MLPSTVGWIFPHQLSKTPPPRFVHGLTRIRLFLIESFSQVIQGCVNLQLKLSITLPCNHKMAVITHTHTLYSSGEAQWDGTVGLWAVDCGLKEITIATHDLNLAPLDFEPKAL